MEIIIWFIVIIAIVLAAAWFLRGYLGSGTANAGGLFAGARDRRIGVLETASVDGRRRLVLIQRDGVEHLVMTGGPVDVVIETGIQGQRRPVATAKPAMQPGGQPASGGYDQFAAAPQQRPDPNAGNAPSFGQMRPMAGGRSSLEP